MNPQERPFTTWLAGLTVGATSGLLFALAPTVGAALALAFLVGVILSRRRAAPVAGLFVGLPSVWLLAIGGAMLSCDQFNSVPGQGCTAPDVTGYAAVALVLLLFGLAGSIRVFRRGGGPSA